MPAIWIPKQTWEQGPVVASRFAAKDIATRMATHPRQKVLQKQLPLKASGKKREHTKKVLDASLPDK